MAAFIYHEFATRHYFNDGNKRFSHVFANVFIVKSKHQLVISYKQAVPFIISIASDKKTVLEIEQWIRNNLRGLKEEAVLEVMLKVMTETINS